MDVKTSVEDAQIQSGRKYGLTWGTGRLPSTGRMTNWTQGGWARLCHACCTMFREGRFCWELGCGEGNVDTQEPEFITCKIQQKSLDQAKVLNVSIWEGFEHLGVNLEELVIDEKERACSEQCFSCLVWVDCSGAWEIFFSFIGVANLLVLQFLLRTYTLGCEINSVFPSDWQSFSKVFPHPVGWSLVAGSASDFKLCPFRHGSYRLWCHGDGLMRTCFKARYLQSYLQWSTAGPLPAVYLCFLFITFGKASFAGGAWVLWLKAFYIPFYCYTSSRQFTD